MRSHRTFYKYFPQKYSVHFKTLRVTSDQRWQRMKFNLDYDFVSFSIFLEYDKGTETAESPPKSQRPSVDNFKADQATFYWTAHLPQDD